MYYCPHPRRIGNFRGPRNQVSPPRERQQQQPPFPIQQAPPVQILRPPVQPQQQQPLPPPPPIAPIPPLPIPENRAVNVISLDAKVKAKEEERGKSLPKDKGKAKVEDVDAMPIKRARQEEAAMSEMGERRKSKENGESNSKKKSKPRRKLIIKDFALGESSQPYNLVDDVSAQGPKITWPQLLHLAPKVRRQWTKMVSTRHVKTKAMGLVSGRNLQDITRVLNAYVKGQRVSNVYVDGGAQICVMTEKTMHRLGLKVNAPAPCKAKMANNSKGEGYPIILGRPWLMAMQARQDWGTGMLQLQPHKGAKKGKAIHIDLRGGKHESLDLETSVDEFSSSNYSTSEEESTITDESDSSQAEIMGVMLTNPTMDEAKPVVQRLRRLGVIQQDALLSEVRKLLNAGFIYPVEDSEWVSPIVVTPKKNGKWRVCVDYKPLNAATKRDHFPLPFQDEILNEVARYERYTVCDGYSGYFQIRIAEEDQKKTTFVTPCGCFAYRVMPFGLTNAPTTFQRFVTHVFQPFFGKSIRVFIDDFCIYSLRVLHLEKVNEGLARLQALGGQLNVDKCHIAESQVTLLGQ
ncbi:hypothetical protein L7F22_028509 [Adiantum nelumboides]|nr:hypothetical protein [Adiantum nelumboides]